MRKRILLLVLVLFVAVSLSLVGCGSDMDKISANDSPKNILKKVASNMEAIGSYQIDANIQFDMMGSKEKAFEKILHDMEKQEISVVLGFGRSEQMYMYANEEKATAYFKQGNSWTKMAETSTTSSLINKPVLTYEEFKDIDNFDNLSVHENENEIYVEGTTTIANFFNPELSKMQNNNVNVPTNMNVESNIQIVIDKNTSYLKSMTIDANMNNFGGVSMTLVISNINQDLEIKAAENITTIKTIHKPNFLGK